MANYRIRINGSGPIYEIRVGTNYNIIRKDRDVPLSLKNLGEDLVGPFEKHRSENKKMKLEVKVSIID